MNIAVTGGRGYYPDDKDLEWFSKTLHEIMRDMWRPSAQDPRKEIRLILGDCPTGVDKWTKQIAIQQKLHYDIKRADWKVDEKKAGPLRNREMINEAEALIAFPGSGGTHDTISQADKKNIIIVLHPKHVIDTHRICKDLEKKQSDRRLLIGMLFEPLINYKIHV
jgi:hypothetical protein